MPATSISSSRARSTGRSRTASSRKAATASSRASACARWRASAPASPIPTKSCRRRCSRRRAPRARSRARAAAARSRPGTRPPAHRLYPPDDPIASLADADKVALLQELDRRARALDPRVKQVVATLAAVHEIVLVAASDGTLAADVRPLVRMNVSVIVEQNGRREQGYAGTGGRYSLEEFIADEKPLRLAREAVRQATVNLESVPAPAGTMTVVLGPGWPGVLLHEAIGHGLEGDFNRRGTSAFTRAHRREGRLRRCARSSTTARCRAARLAQHRRRRHADLLHDADRERRAEGLPAGQAQRAAHGHEADRQRPARVLRAHDAAAHDEHLHAAGAARPAGDHPLGASAGSTRSTSAAARSTSPRASSCSRRARPT